MKMISQLGFFLVVISSFCMAGENSLLPPRLSVSGKAVLYKPADQFSLNIGVVNQNADAQIALKKNSEQMQKVIEALTEAGLSKTEMKTGRFSIRPVYSEPPKIPPPDWSPKITGYEVANSLTIQTQQLGAAGIIIDAANRAGANSIDSIRFEFKDPRQYRDEAIQTAARNAISDAKVLAEASGVKLSRILAINLDNASIAPVFRERASLMMFKGSAANASTPIEAGDVEVRADVLTIYEIE